MKPAAVALLAVAAVALAAPAHAQDWPSKPVRVVVPVAPGGGADTVGRVLADYLGRALNQKFFVENRVGASGMVGSAMVAHAEPDGYNFVISGMPSHAVAPAVTAKPEFDPVKDFTHIAYVGGAPVVLVANPTLGVKSVKDLLALARSRADAIDYASPGVGSLGNLTAEYLAQKENIRLEQIPYKGGSLAVADMVGGHVKLGLMSLTPVGPHIQAGTLVPLAVTSARRLSDLPDVPTFKELGYDDLVAIAWWSFSGPAGLPQPIVQKVHDLIGQALAVSGTRARLQREGMLLESMSQPEVARFIASEVAKWGPIARKALAAPKR
jgi:tripartite-type tricarboxylate transporter receptor subunit TctC